MFNRIVWKKIINDFLKENDIWYWEKLDQGFMSRFLLLKLDLQHLGKKQKKKIRNIFALIK